MHLMIYSKSEAMLHSCGALLHTISPTGIPGVILGTEGFDDKYLPFKGCPNEKETFEQAACREVAEETCGLVQVNQIQLWNNFSTRHKHYHMGLIFVDYAILEQFEEVRKTENRKAFLEKKNIKFFPLHSVLQSPEVHLISKTSINFYWDTLWNTVNKAFSNSLSRCQGVRQEYAVQVYNAICPRITKPRPRISPPNRTLEVSMPIVTH